MNAAIKVLLVEHDPSDARLIVEELGSSGLVIELKQVTSRSEFFKVYALFCPDLVLSDYVIGKIPGLAVMKELRKTHPDQPFIFVSWEIHEDSVIEALKEGATDYVFKENLSRLTLSVHRALRETAERRDREQAQAGLQKSEEYFRSLIENAGDIIMVLDGGAIVRFASPSVKKLLGYEPADFIGKDILTFIHQEDRENAQFVLVQSRDKKDFSIEFRFRHKGGSWRGIEAIGRTLLEEGRAKVILNARDITDRILEQEALRESIIRHLKTQTELQKAQQKAIQQERMAAVGQMASGIAHDFSNALMPVLGFSEILLSRPETLQDLEKARKYVEMINTSARDAMHIIGGLREFYRQKEKAENLQQMDLNKTLEEVMRLTQPKWKEEAYAKGLNIQVTTKLEPLPIIMGNEAKMREALTNLVFNAVDAMPQGGKIQLSSRPEAGKICIKVADTGIGMDEQALQRCFEPFYSTKGKAGTGLGLSMVYGVVRRQGGTIDVKSQPGKGTTFTIRLPVQPAGPAPAPEKSEAPVPKVLEKKLSVLVVDDEALVRQVLADYLSGDGHSVDTACDGHQALDVFKKKKFDLVVTDRAMPEMNGDQLALALKKLAPDLPLVMLTGFGELMKAKGEHPKGVDFLLSKPLTLDVFREVLSKAAAKLPAHS